MRGSLTGVAGLVTFIALMSLVEALVGKMARNGEVVVPAIAHIVLSIILLCSIVIADALGGRTATNQNVEQSPSSGSKARLCVLFLMLWALITSAVAPQFRVASAIYGFSWAISLWAGLFIIPSRVLTLTRGRLLPVVLVTATLLVGACALGLLGGGFSATDA
ncbi:hypothetical protein OAQ71_00135 [bacterium]|nr:hypothetical protein [bacterium]